MLAKWTCGRGQQRFLDGVLGGLEVPVVPHERGDDQRG
jgi:hypothetical protein